MVSLPGVGASGNSTRLLMSIFAVELFG